MILILKLLENHKLVHLTSLQTKSLLILLQVSLSKQPNPNSARPHHTLKAIAIHSLNNIISNSKPKTKYLNLPLLPVMMLNSRTKTLSLKFCLIYLCKGKRINLKVSTPWLACHILSILKLMEPTLFNLLFLRMLISQKCSRCLPTSHLLLLILPPQIPQAQLATNNKIKISNIKVPRMEEFNMAKTSINSHSSLNSKAQDKNIRMTKRINSTEILMVNT